MAIKELGGYGHLAYGQHKYGARDSLDFQYPTPTPIGPRFNVSTPANGTYGVALTQWITYEIYYYTSSIGVDPSVLPSNLPVEISEDAGDTWVDATSAPYTLMSRFKDGHTLWIKLTKAGSWAVNSEILIRTTLPDEYGQDITGIAPVRWE